MRANVGDFHRLWYNKALKLFGKVNVEESRKRIVWEKPLDGTHPAILV